MLWKLFWEQWVEFAKRIRWIAIHPDNKKASNREKEEKGFKTTRLSDQNDSLNSFENAMYNLIFKKPIDSFPKELSWMMWRRLIPSKVEIVWNGDVGMYGAIQY